MINKNKKLLNIPFPKLNSDNTHIEFQIIDMKTLFEIKTNHNIEYAHRLEFNLILIMLEGKGIHNIDFKPYEYSQGTIFFIKKHQVHSFQINPDSNCFLLQFTDNFLNNILKNSVYDIFDYMRYPVNLQLDKKSLEDLLNNINLLSNQLSFQNDEFTEPILQALLESLILQLKRQRKGQTIILENKDQQIYQRFLNLVHNSHTYSKNVQYYSKELDISSRTLTNLLNKYTGKSTKIYLNEFLLLEIKRQLFDKSLTIQNIADKLEFDEPTNLIKFFKRFERITPKEYRQIKKI